VSDAPQWPQQYLVPPYSRAAATASLRSTRSYQGERTVFPCTKSAVVVGGTVARYGLFRPQQKCRGDWVNKETSTHFTDGTITRGRPDEPSSTVSDV
jgi:hypothetical protein